MESWPALAVLPIVFAIHEWAHAAVALHSGDRTPLRQGRVTLNPLQHMDFWGTIVIPVVMFALSRGAFFFAYARPVIIRPERFRKPRVGLALVGAAGPLANLLTGSLAAIVWRMLPPIAILSPAMLWFALLSLTLSVLNMLPIPPLDGSRVLQLCLPNDAAALYLEHGVWAFPATLVLYVGCLAVFKVDLIGEVMGATALRLFDCLTGT